MVTPKSTAAPEYGTAANAPGLGPAIGVCANERRVGYRRAQVSASGGQALMTLVSLRPSACMPAIRVWRAANEETRELEARMVPKVGDRTEVVKPGRQPGHRRAPHKKRPPKRSLSLRRAGPGARPVVCVQPKKSIGRSVRDKSTGCRRASARPMVHWIIRVQITPCASMASATLTKPARLAPLT